MKHFTIEITLFMCLLLSLFTSLTLIIITKDQSEYIQEIENQLQESTSINDSYEKAFQNVVPRQYYEVEISSLQDALSQCQNQ